MKLLIYYIMKGIELLSFLSREQRNLLETSESNYKRFARIYFQVLSCEENKIVVKVWQQENPAGKYLSAKELVERSKSVFNEDVLPPEVKLHVRPIPFEQDELKTLTVTDIEKKMQQYGLQPKDLVKLLDIDKSSLSLILNHGRELTKSGKAMFYYFFKSLERSQSVNY
ncbi:hypothetical protein [Viscerimonas tarda]